MLSSTVKVEGRVKGGTVFAMAEDGRLTRYTVRNTLFRMRDNRDFAEGDEVIAGSIYKAILGQLQRGETLETFTFNWDIHPTNVLEVLRPADWRAMKKHLHPKAFSAGKRVTTEERLFTFQEPDMKHKQPNYRRHLKEGLQDLKRETLRILQLPLDRELAALASSEEMAKAKEQAMREAAEEAEVEKAERELAHLMSVAQSRMKEGFDVSDIMAKMAKVSEKLKVKRKNR